jgi:hypothetical protein
MLDSTLGRLLGVLVGVSYIAYTLWILVWPLIETTEVTDYKYVGLAAPTLILSTGLAIVGVTAGVALWTEPDAKT